MPYYDYKCGDCGKIFEVFKGMNDDNKVECMHCRKLNTKRVFNTFSRGHNDSEILDSYGSENSAGGCGTCTIGACGSCSGKN